MAKAWDAELTVLTISTALSPAELRELAQVDHDLGIATETLVRRILDDAVARANRHGVVDVKTLSMSGDPANVDTEDCAGERADLIVVAAAASAACTRLCSAACRKRSSLTPTAPSPWCHNQRCTSQHNVA